MSTSTGSIVVGPWGCLGIVVLFALVLAWRFWLDKQMRETIGIRFSNDPVIAKPMRAFDIMYFALLFLDIVLVVICVVRSSTVLLIAIAVVTAALTICFGARYIVLRQLKKAKNQ